MDSTQLSCIKLGKTIATIPTENYKSDVIKNQAKLLMLQIKSHVIGICELMELDYKKVLRKAQKTKNGNMYIDCLRLIDEPSKDYLVKVFGAILHFESLLKIGVKWDVD